MRHCKACRNNDTSVAVTLVTNAGDPGSIPVREVNFYPNYVTSVVGLVVLGSVLVLRRRPPLLHWKVLQTLIVQISEIII